MEVNSNDIPKMVSFDIEIANEIPQGEDWHDHMPLPIACAATAVRDDMGNVRTKFYYNLTEDEMNAQDLSSMVLELMAYWSAGYKIVTVNGVGFDFPVLADASLMHPECAMMMLGHIDLCFIPIAFRGFPVGLAAMSKGAGVEGKEKTVVLNDGSILSEMHGARAPAMWRAGERDAVLEYLKGDVRSTLEAAEVIAKRGKIIWTSRSGRLQTVVFSHQFGGVPTVADCLEVPIPDTSWMTEPKTRDGMLGWAVEYVPSLKRDYPQLFGN